MYEVLYKDTIIFEIPPHLSVAKSGIVLLIIKAVAFYVSVFLPDADVVLGAQNGSDGDFRNTIFFPNVAFNRRREAQGAGELLNDLLYKKGCCIEGGAMCGWPHTAVYLMGFVQHVQVGRHGAISYLYQLF